MQKGDGTWIDSHRGESSLALTIKATTTTVSIVILFFGLQATADGDRVAVTILATGQVRISFWRENSHEVSIPDHRHNFNILSRGGVTTK